MLNELLLLLIFILFGAALAFIDGVKDVTVEDVLVDLAKAKMPLMLLLLLLLLWLLLETLLPLILLL
jgi:hypothetical protein